MIADVYVVALAALTALSLRTLVVLRASAPWTSLGWLATIGYDVTASVEIVRRVHVPLHLAYLFLAALAIAFVVAGVRDEPQGEPWWWPSRLGATRAARKGATR